MEFKLRPTNLIQPPAILVIGSSTGGLQALEKFFTDLCNCAIDIPIAITQHIPENFDKSFSNKIEMAAKRKCKMAEDGEILEAGIIYFAPSERHFTISKRAGKKYAVIDDSPPVNFCKPAVDPMFKSAAKAYGKNVLAIVFTGIGNDGLEGAKDIVSNGGAIIAQDRETSIVWGMPAAVAKAELCSAILPLNEIAAFVKEYSFGKIR